MKPPTHRDEEQQETDEELEGKAYDRLIEDLYAAPPDDGEGANESK